MPENHPPKVVTRFAPSPTGELHIGGARTALFAWAFARGNGGQFLLRFEDTDQKRSSRQAEQNILRDLEWLGLRGENHDSPGGGGIPRQSERLDLYQAALDKLKAGGHTYDDDEAVRFRMDRDVAFDDALYGHIAVEAKDLEDFVIQKADGFPTFHLAVVVDDADMGVTHVIRGQEHLSNTAKHAALCDALGIARPVWCHTPSIMNPDGSKMSKRDKAKVARQAAKVGGWPSPATVDSAHYDSFMAKDNDDSEIATAIAEQYQVELPEINVADFRRSGYTPEVLLNYLALLGWNPGNDRERFDLDYLCEHFDFGRIGKSNSKFDREKLAAFSQDTFLQMPPEVWIKTLRLHFKEYHPEYVEKLGSGFDVFAMAYKERSKTLSDPAESGKFFVEAPTEFNDKAVKKNLTKNDGEGLAALAKARQTLAGLPMWEAEPIHNALDRLWPQLELKNMGGVAQPLRVAITGNAVSPEIGPTLEILGRDETLSRIDRCLEVVPV